MAKRSVGIIAFLLCFCLCLMPYRAQAAATSDAKEPLSTEQDCSLTISYGSDDADFSALPVKLYKIADVSADYRYTLTSSFASSKLILNGIQSAGEWNVIRSTLQAYIPANGVKADVTANTDDEGDVAFDTLTAGLYLATTDRVVRNDATYVFDAALIALPGLSAEGLWQYSVTVNAKCTIVPPSQSDDGIELSVTKLWKGDKGKTRRPKSVEVEIFRNGTSYQTVKLSNDNHWTYRWKAPDDGSNWQVAERNIPTGYTMTLEQRETAFVLTNTLDRDIDDDPNAPQTGDTANIMLWFILMIVSGSMLVILGITRKRSRV